jgi:hypothetical protein
MDVEGLSWSGRLVRVGSTGDGDAGGASGWLVCVASVGEGDAVRASGGADDGVRGGSGGLVHVGSLGDGDAKAVSGRSSAPTSFMGAGKIVESAAGRSSPHGLRTGPAVPPSRRCRSPDSVTRSRTASAGPFQSIANCLSFEARNGTRRWWAFRSAFRPVPLAANRWKSYDPSGTCGTVLLCSRPRNTNTRCSWGVPRYFLMAIRSWHWHAWDRPTQPGKSNRIPYRGGGGDGRRGPLCAAHCRSSVDKAGASHR